MIDMNRESIKMSENALTNILKLLIWFMCYLEKKHCFR